MEGNALLRDFGKENVVVLFCEAYYTSGFPNFG